MKLLSLYKQPVVHTDNDEADVTRPFLTARWTNLVLANYRVPMELLLPHVPPGSELDTPDEDPGLHLLSLVAMRFAHTHVYGIPVPTAQSFPEVNLRFYVRRGSMRACVFLREFVPVPLVALGAWLFYNQPYRLATLAHEVQTQGKMISVHTEFKHRQHHGEIRLLACNDPITPSPDSQEHFLKEHYWGFDRARSGKSFRYRVSHPVWRTYPIEQVEVTIDPGAILGGAWKVIDWRKALHSVLFAEGSLAVVYEAEPLCREASQVTWNGPPPSASPDRSRSGDAQDTSKGGAHETAGDRSPAAVSAADPVRL